MIEIVKGDITELDVDAVVNAANTRLQRGGGVDHAVHQAAGPELQQALQSFGGCPTGGAVLTPGFKMRARWIVHAVGPVWQGGGVREADLLSSAYHQAFARAKEHGGIRSIAFPAISTGVFAFPRDQAARIAIDTMLAHEDEFDRVVACLFDEDSVDLYRRTLESMRKGGA
jgi:O-acetyl-ADP-ribose deacetylase (regulator of RNase III)